MDEILEWKLTPEEECEIQRIAAIAVEHLLDSMTEEQKIHFCNTMRKAWEILEKIYIK